MGNRPGTNKNSYLVVTAQGPEQFQKALQKATDEIADKEGARHFATQTTMAMGESFSPLWSGVLFYDYDDEHQPGALASKKLCPNCGELIPQNAEQHLKCGWNVKVEELGENVEEALDKEKLTAMAEDEVTGDYPDSDSTARDLED